MQNIKSQCRTYIDWEYFNFFFQFQCPSLPAENIRELRIFLGAKSTEAS